MVVNVNVVTMNGYPALRNVLRFVLVVSRLIGIKKEKMRQETKTRNKRLDVDYKRACDCGKTNINCLTAKEWLKNQIALWEFFYEGRDVRDKDIHPAVFPISLPKKCIELFTHKGELVLDPFAGLGTTLVAAEDTGRNAVGFDLSKKYVNYARKRLSQQNQDTKQIMVCDDALNIPDYLDEETVSLCVTSPPYANMLNRPRLNKSLRGDKRVNSHYKKIQQYSDNSRDLGTMESKKYVKELGRVYKKILPLLKPKSHCVINITDLWWENKRMLIHVGVIEEMEKAGYELRNTIIWDRRNLVNGAGIFGWPSNYITLGTTFEYILDFWRPPE